MKNTLLAILFLLALGSEVVAQKNDKEEKKEAEYKLFSVEGSHFFNGFINKHAVNAKFYIWINKSYNFGFEFFNYFPTVNRPSYDFQIDLNFRKILVDFHPVSFDVLLGPGVRNGVNLDSGEREWTFDGINIGFGMAYRVKNISIFIMPRINHIDPSLQVSSGIKYHFDIERALKFKNRYKLNKT